MHGLKREDGLKILNSINNNQFHNAVNPRPRIGGTSSFLFALISLGIYWA